MVFRTSVFIVICLYLTVHVTECGRYGGGGRLSGGSRRVTVSRPATVYRPHPSPPVYHPTSVYHPPVHHPSPSRDSSHRNDNVRPLGFDPPKASAPVAPPKHSSPVASAPPREAGGSGTVRPIGFNVPRNSDSSHHGNSQETPKHSAPLGNAPPPYSPGGTGIVRPIGFTDSGHSSSSNHGAPKHSAPLGNAPPPYTPGGTGIVRPIGFTDPGHSSSSNHGAPKHSAPLGNAPPPYTPGNYGQNQPPYNPHYNPAGHVAPPAYSPAGHAAPNPAGYGPPPTYTAGNYQGGYHSQGGGYHPQGGNYPQGGYHPQGGGFPQGGYQPQGGYGYHPQGGGGTTIINNNINNHHSYGGGYGGGYGGFGGWSYSAPVYTSHDTGSTALGFFLGYSLAKISTPSYHYHNSYYDSNGYTPRYDHYTIHHYYHNKDTVPKEATIEPNAIVACVGDSGSFCPAGTTSLCTNNGAVMCVASATSTVPCTNEKQTNCVKSSVPCKDNNSPECKQASDGKASISIPCISTAKVYGSISYVNNSIVVSNATSDSNSINPVLSQPATGNETLNSNITATNTNNSFIINESGTNATSVENGNSNSTNPNPLVSTNGTVAINSTGVEKGPPQMFCVTVIALPAERKLTEGEKLFGHTKDIVSKFAVKALGID